MRRVYLHTPAVDTGEDTGPEYGEDEDDVEEPPPTFWEGVSDAARGLIALLLVALGVLALYVAGGVFLGVLVWAAPAVLAIGAAVILARYLSRPRD